MTTMALRGADCLASLRWYKAVVTFESKRVRKQQAHSLWIFQAIINHACRGASVDKYDVIFHPLRPLEWKIEQGEQYVVEIILPDRKPERIKRFLEGLAEHLDKPGTNFALVSIKGPFLRSIEHLADELKIPSHNTELCLNFTTPVIFPRKDKKRYWLVDTADFINSLYNRINKLFGMTLQPELKPPDIRLLPYYWDKISIKNTSATNNHSFLTEGLAGPLYIRGDLKTILPYLRACSELHLGMKNKAFRNGFGYYSLTTSQPYFDNLIKDESRFETALQSILEHCDVDDKLNSLVLDKKDRISTLHRRLATGEYLPASARGFYLGKRGGGKRLIATLDPEDYLVQKFINQLMAPVIDHCFEHASIGFRPGRSREDAATMIKTAFREGFTHIVESDIAAFFDSIDWSILEEKIDNHLPQADSLARQLLHRIITTPLTINERIQQRSKGLLQGSPISPLLANLYLDSLDEEMEAKGFRLIRYADDFLILTRSRKEALTALEAVSAALAKLRLELKMEKTRTGLLDDGFTFLGLSFSPGLERSILDSARPVKTLFITNRYLYVGLDYDSIVLKKNRALLARLPLRQVDDIIIIGNNTLSSKFLRRCASSKIAVSFCSPFGHYTGTLLPNSKTAHRMNGLHYQHHFFLTPGQKLACARDIVSAKINNYLTWFRGSWPASTAKKEICRLLQETVTSVANAENVDEIRGYEGRAAKYCFRFINNRVKNSFFTSNSRVQQKRADAWNSLLDFTYALLFTRLNVLIRTRGLNPYLGLLHSEHNRYPSFASDLQEPFRSRIDRFLLRLVNLQIIREEHFAKDDFGRCNLTSEGIATVLEYFEKEMSTRLRKEEGNFRQLLIAQVHTVQQWIEKEKERFPLYRAE